METLSHLMEEEKRMGTILKFSTSETEHSTVEWKSVEDSFNMANSSIQLSFPVIYKETIQIGNTQLVTEIIYEQHPQLQVVEKKIRVHHIAGKSLTVLQASVSIHSPDEGTKWSSAEVGQPVYLEHSGFAAIRHPYGMSEVSRDGRDLFMWHYPGAELIEGQCWESSIFVYGSASEGTVRQLFDDYVHTIAKFQPKRIWIYGDWALHDELAEKGRSVELTEVMTRDNVDFLRSIDQQHGIHFDYYMVDHGWYSKNSFKEVKQPNFQTKGLRWLSEHLSEMKVKLGLWFPVNTYSENDDGIFCGVDTDKSKKRKVEGRSRFAYCLKSDYGQHFLDSMLHAIEEWGVKLIKLDFASFECNDPECLHHLPANTGDLKNAILREQECDIFLNMMREINAKHPDVMIVAFNGFVPSPWWLETIDTLYIGDVQPCDVPTYHLRTSMNLFTAQRLNRYERDHNVHRDFLDDCGTFIGETTTSFYLGKEDWRSQALLSLGRGLKLVYYYGDLRLLDHDNLQFLGEISAYDRKSPYSTDSYTLGMDNGQQWFAYIHDQYSAVYNPTLMTLKQSLTLANDVTIQVELKPYEVKWINNEDSKQLFASGGIAGLLDGEPISEGIHVQQQGSRYTVTLDHTGGEWIHYVTFYNQNQLVRSHQPSKLCKVESNYPYRIIPDHYCWNGIPWLAIAVSIPSDNDRVQDPVRIELETIDEWKSCSIRSESWWIPCKEEEA
jgi:hypothetical protein